MSNTGACPWAAFRERTYQREAYELRGMPVKIEIDTDILSYEGWMQYSKFGGQINNITNGFAQVGQAYYRDFTGQRYAVATSIGQLSETNPVDGNATWEGVMIGGRIGETVDFGDPVRGDATLTFDFADADLDVAFTNIQSLRNVEVPATYPDMTWENLAVRDGRFGGGFDEPTIEGRFYGPNHEEVGGIFQRSRIVGAFGAQTRAPRWATLRWEKECRGRVKDTKSTSSNTGSPKNRSMRRSTGRSGWPTSRRNSICR